jgi:ankyrin repeat protein
MNQLVSFQQLANKGLGPNLILSNGSPALVYAMQRGSKEVAEWLMARGDIDVNLTDVNGDSALMLASYLGEITWVQTLLKKGALINPSGWTPLHYAASNAQVSVVQLLIANGAQVNALSPNGTTPLMMAARVRSTESAVALIKQGANTKLVNQAGFSALNYAEKTDNSDLKIILLKSDN